MAPHFTHIHSSPLLSSPLLSSPLLSASQGGHHEKWQEGISTYLGPDFVLIVQVHLWEMGLFVFVHRTLHPFVNNVQRTTEVRVCVYIYIYINTGNSLIE